MNEPVIFPQLCGLNWPSYLLQAWRTLHELGVPEEHVRFVPEIGHFAVPEISAQEPPGPRYDPLSRRVTVHPINPATVRPRLTVGIRAETVMRFWEFAPGQGERHDERMVGRLAHFLPPLQRGLPGSPPEGDTTEDPLARLTRQVCARYPEMMRTLPAEVCERLDRLAGEALALLALDNGNPPPARLDALTFTHPAQQADAESAFGLMAGKLPLQGIADLSDQTLPAARAWFPRWGEALREPEAPAAQRRWEQLRDELSPVERAQQRALWLEFQRALVYENAQEREKIVRDLLEIMTTEAFLAVAAIDSLCGIGWAHGRMSDQDVTPHVSPRARPHPDGLLLSVTGGWNSRSLLLSRLRGWAETGGVLGIGYEAPGAQAGESGRDREWLDMGALEEGERQELLALATWRREAADPVVLLETAARRLIHPEVTVRWQRFGEAPSRFGTLLAQPARTAVLGGAALLQFPGVTIFLPLSEDADEQAIRAKTTLALLERVFLPVCCRVEVVWQEAVARLGQACFLQHEYQQGVRLADAWAALEDRENSQGMETEEALVRPMASSGTAARRE